VFTNENALAARYEDLLCISKINCVSSIRSARVHARMRRSFAAIKKALALKVLSAILPGAFTSIPVLFP